MTQPFLIDNSNVERFAADLDRIAPRGSSIGVAVSGGPDSVALLLLAWAVRAGEIEAATVDHGLRPEAADEAKMVADLCARLGVAHATLHAEWEEKPESAVQERARNERYRLLDRWASERGLDVLATAHHLDDQAETVLMRLNRGAGVRGLAGMRAASSVPAEGSSRPLIRPLLDWRRAELEEVCRTAGIEPVDDPSNVDEQFERVRIRRALAANDWLDLEEIAGSAAHLASADEALCWASDREWDEQLRQSGDALCYRPNAPAEIRRRIALRCIAALASEGKRNPLRGGELDRLIATLASGGTATIRGVLCSGGEEWSFKPAPPRQA